MAGFDRGNGLLYVVQDGRVVTLYKPREGILTTIGLTSPGAGPSACVETPLTGSTSRGSRVYAIAHPEFQALFDNMASNPTAFVNATAAGPPDYTSNGTFKSARTLIAGPELKVEKGLGYIGIAHARDQLLAMRAEDVSPQVALIRQSAAGAEGRAQQRAAAIRTANAEFAAAKRAAAQAARDQFSRASHSPKSIGQSVCSVDNRFGYVEAASGSKIKINVRGRAAAKRDDAFEPTSPHGPFEVDRSRLSMEDRIGSQGSDLMVPVRDAYYLFHPLPTLALAPFDAAGMVWDEGSYWGECGWRFS